MANKRAYKAMQNLTDDRILTVHWFNVDYPSRTIWLTGRDDRGVGDMETLGDPGVEYSMANQFLRNIALLEGQSHGPVVINMKTAGGDVAEGMAIYDAIAASPCPITIYAYAHARSMSSIILQAADLRVLMPNTFVMLHWGDIEVAGDARRAMAFVEWEKRVGIPTMMHIYSQRMSRTVGSKWFGEYAEAHTAVDAAIAREGDFYLTAAEAVTWGLADEVLE